MVKRPYHAISRLQNDTLDNRQLRSSNIKRIDIGGQPSESLLGTIWPDEGVDLDAVHIVKLLERSLDLTLVGLDIHDEHQGVVLLNLLHRRFGVERVDDDLVVVETGLMGNTLARILGCAGELQSLGTVERRRLADLGDLVGIDLHSL